MVTDPDAILAALSPGEQAIVVQHDPATGKLDVTFDQTMPLSVLLGLLVDAVYTVFQNGFIDQPTPFPEGSAKVCLQLEGQKLSMAFGRDGLTADPVLAQAMLVTAMFELCRKTNGGEFDPAEALLGKIIFEVDQP